MSNGAEVTKRIIEMGGVEVELFHQGEAFEKFVERFWGRFFDRLEASTVISSDECDVTFLQEVFDAIHNNIMHEITSEMVGATRAHDVIVSTIAAPELCADIAIIALERRVT
ncbi:MAG: hypothetical protein OXF86_13310 [Caldilineaceae bacterium]|nr:hypothetical protein [Caldilineaceae bacterium]